MIWPYKASRDITQYQGLEISFFLVMQQMKKLGKIVIERLLFHSTCMKREFPIECNGRRQKEGEG